MGMNFRPLHDRVVVKRIDEEEKTAGGIIIPDTAKEKPMQGEIVAAGPGMPGPAATISPCIGFSFAVSGMIMPPAVFSSSSMRLTTTRSCRGLKFMPISRSLLKSFPDLKLPADGPTRPSHIDD